MIQCIFGFIISDISQISHLPVHVHCFEIQSQTVSSVIHCKFCCMIKCLICHGRCLFIRFQHCTGNGINSIGQIIYIKAGVVITILIIVFIIIALSITVGTATAEITNFRIVAEKVCFFLTLLCLQDHIIRNIFFCIRICTDTDSISHSQCC